MDMVWVRFLGLTYLDSITAAALILTAVDLLLLVRRWKTRVDVDVPPLLGQ